MSEERPRVLVVDDEPLILEAWREALAERFDVSLFLDPLAAARHAAQPEAEVDVALLDLRMPGMDGLALMRHVRESQPGAEVIFVTGHGSISLAVDAMQHGAFDFLEKPIDDLEGAIRTVARAAERRRRRARTSSVPADAGLWLVGESRAMREVAAQVERLAISPLPVLVRGERGAGKSHVARALHERGPRRDRPLVVIAAGSLGELATDSGLGAHGGTIVVEQLEELPATAQARLAHALALADDAARGGLTARLVATTSGDPERLVREGRLRDDLVARLRTFELALPALRDRRGDVPRLAACLLARHARQVGRPGLSLGAEALEALYAHAWPGNVAELERAMAHAATLAAGEVITPGDLPVALTARDRPRRESLAAIGPGTLASAPYAEARARMLEDFERRYLQELLEQSGGNLSEASRRSGVDRSNLRRMLRRAGFIADVFKPSRDEP